MWLLVADKLLRSEETARSLTQQVSVHTKRAADLQATADAQARQIAELTAQVAQLQTAAAVPAAPVTDGQVRVVIMNSRAPWGGRLTELCLFCNVRRSEKLKTEIAVLKSQTKLTQEQTKTTTDLEAVRTGLLQFACFVC